MHDTVYNFDQSSHPADSSRTLQGLISSRGKPWKTRLCVFLPPLASESCAGQAAAKPMVELPSKGSIHPLNLPCTLCLPLLQLTRIPCQGFNMFVLPGSGPAQTLAAGMKRKRTESRAVAHQIEDIASLIFAYKTFGTCVVLLI